MEKLIQSTVNFLKEQPASYFIAQFFGILVTIGVIANMQMKKKLQMLTVSVFINLFSATNILLLEGKINSGVIVCFVAVAQLILSIIHEIKNTKVTLAEKIFFLILYLAGGIYGIAQPLDCLTTIAALFYMIAMFQKKEQHIRLILLANLSCWTIYLAITGSTSLFAQIAGIISSLIALFRFRKQQKTASD